MRIHIVQKGDTLWKIAQKYGVDFNQLKSLNSHLSNPDQIMPGMKIKVPTNSGTVKKEIPIKEKPIQKEVPLTEHPFVQEKPPTIPVQPSQSPKEIIKEVPKPIFVPKPVKPIIPEIDINNYYTVNMAKMNIEQQAPVQKAEIPVFEKEEPIKEMPVPPKIEKPVEEVQTPPMVQQPILQPIYPCSPCVPMTPILPGSGFPCMPVPQVFCSPCHQPFQYGIPYVTQPIMPGFTESMLQGTGQQMMMPTMYGGAQTMGGMDPGALQPMMPESDPQMLLQGNQPSVSYMPENLQQTTGMQMGTTDQMMWDEDDADETINDQFNPYQIPLTQNPMITPEQMPYTTPLPNNPMLQSTNPSMMQPTFPINQPMSMMPGQFDDCGCGGSPLSMPQFGPMMGTLPHYAQTNIPFDAYQMPPGQSYGATMPGMTYPQIGGVPGFDMTSQMPREFQPFENMPVDQSQSFTSNPNFNEDEE